MSRFCFWLLFPPRLSREQKMRPGYCPASKEGRDRWLLLFSDVFVRHTPVVKGSSKQVKLYVQAGGAGRNFPVSAISETSFEKKKNEVLLQLKISTLLQKGFL